MIPAKIPPNVHTQHDGTTTLDLSLVLDERDLAAVEKSAAAACDLAAIIDKKVLAAPPAVPKGEILLTPRGSPEDLAAFLKAKQQLTAHAQKTQGMLDDLLTNIRKLETERLKVAEDLSAPDLVERLVEIDAKLAAARTEFTRTSTAGEVIIPLLDKYRPQAETTVRTAARSALFEARADMERRRDAAIEKLLKKAGSELAELAASIVGLSRLTAIESEGFATVHQLRILD